MKQRKAPIKLVEVMMVLLLGGVLAAVAVTQFTDYAAQARNAALKADLRLVRKAIAEKTKLLRERCGAPANAFPPLDALIHNDITASAAALCTVDQVAPGPERRFTPIGIPRNGWGPAQSAMVAACSDAGCTDRTANGCEGSPRDPADDGWCYNPTNGDFWANSARNDGAASTTGHEYRF